MKEGKSDIQKIKIQDLRELAIYLEGLKRGQGNLYPLGTVNLETLWETIKYLNDRA